jgi:hypothetical protein
MNTIRKFEYKRLTGKNRDYIKGHKYTLLSRKKNLTLKGRKALKELLEVNKRLNTAYPKSLFDNIGNTGLEPVTPCLSIKKAKN